MTPPLRAIDYANSSIGVTSAAYCLVILERRRTNLEISTMEGGGLGIGGSAEDHVILSSLDRRETSKSSQVCLDAEAFRSTYFELVDFLC